MNKKSDPTQNKYICPNGCGPGHEASSPCPLVIAASDHARLNWKTVRDMRVITWVCT